MAIKAELEGYWDEEGKLHITGASFVKCAHDDPFRLHEMKVKNELQKETLKSRIKTR